MLDEAATGLSIVDKLVGIFEKISDRVMQTKNQKKKRREIERLIQLLNEIGIGRTLNMGVVHYMMMVARGNDDKEKSILVSQVSDSLNAVIRIMDEMAEEKDRAIIYENEAFNNLRIVASARAELLWSFQRVAEKKDYQKIRIIAERYEQIAESVRVISRRLAMHGRQLDGELS